MKSYCVHDIEDQDWHDFKSKLSLNDKINDVFLEFIKNYKREVKEDELA